MTHDQGPTPGDHPRQWDAAYVLGALTPAERLEYEAYLAEHPAAQSDVADLAGIPGLLRGLTTAEALALLDDDEDAVVRTESEGSGARTGQGTVQSIAGRLRARSRRRRITAAVAGAAAAVVLIAGGFVLGGVRAGAPGSSSSEPFAAMTPAAGATLTADLGLVSKKWGTRIDWHCSYATSWASGSGSYDLVVTDLAGEKTTVATWKAIGGDATDLSAATDIPASSIRAVSITVSGSSEALATRRF